MSRWCFWNGRTVLFQRIRSKNIRALWRVMICSGCLTMCRQVTDMMACVSKHNTLDCTVVVVWMPGSCVGLHMIWLRRLNLGWTCWPGEGEYFPTYSLTHMKEGEPHTHTHTHGHIQGFSCIKKAYKRLTVLIHLLQRRVELLLGRIKALCCTLLLWLKQTCIPAQRSE